VRPRRLTAIGGRIDLPGSGPQNDGVIPFFAGADAHRRSGLLRGEFAGGDCRKPVKSDGRLGGRLDAVRCQPC
jgi:hypothetical protein